MTQCKFVEIVCTYLEFDLNMRRNEADLNDWLYKNRTLVNLLGENEKEHLRNIFVGKKQAINFKEAA